MKLLHFLADTLYPRRCALCDGLLAKGERLVCAACRQDLDLRPHRFPGGFAPLRYAGAAQGSVLRMKYAERPEFAQFFARAIAAVGREQFARWKAEAVVPVPIHHSRLAQRGYNQAEEVARHIAQLLRLPLRADLLLRTKRTRPQKGLDREARSENLKGAFVCCLREDMPARVLLVDDIYTSGATVREATEALAAAGVREVHVVCATRAGVAMGTVDFVT